MSRLTQPVARYALLAAAAIAVAGLGLTLVFGAPAERQAIWLSAGVALPVQVVAFSVAWLMARAQHGVAGWGLGALVSLLTLVIYGTIVRGLGLPSTAALVSLATFLFITELIEPPLLNHV